MRGEMKFMRLGKEPWHLSIKKWGWMNFAGGNSAGWIWWSKNSSPLNGTRPRARLRYQMMQYTKYLHFLQRKILERKGKSRRRGGTHTSV